MALYGWQRRRRQTKGVSCQQYFCGQDAFFFRLQQQKVQSDDTNRYLSMYVSHWRKSIKFHIPFLYNIEARRDMIGTND